jgi:hypothetical protein
MKAKNPSDDELVEAFKVAAREFIKKPDAESAFYSSSLAITKYTEAKRACVNAGIPESVLQEVVDIILAERGGVSR